jgi:hypothetical protein
MTTSGTARHNFPTDDYFVGLFDGEGCVSLHLAKAGYISVQVKVSMCDRAPVVALHQRFGGRFDDGKTQTKTGRRVYTWSMFNAECVEALEIFAIKCLVKQEVSSAALPVAASMKENPTRGVLSQDEKAARLEAAKIIARINKPVGKRRVLDENAVAIYMAPKRMGGGKKVRLSDGRVFNTVSEAADALGVTVSAVSYAKRKGGRTAGFLVEVV